MIRDPTFICQGDGIGERDSGQACAESPWIDAQNRDAGAIVVEVLVQKRSETRLYRGLGVGIHHGDCARHNRCVERDIERIRALSE